MYSAAYFVFGDYLNKPSGFESVSSTRIYTMNWNASSCYPKALDASKWNTLYIDYINIQIMHIPVVKENQACQFHFDGPHYNPDASRSNCALLCLSENLFVTWHQFVDFNVYHYVAREWKKEMFNGSNFALIMEISQNNIVKYNLSMFKFKITTNQRTGST